MATDMPTPLLDPVTQCCQTCGGTGIEKGLVWPRDGGRYSECEVAVRPCPSCTPGYAAPVPATPSARRIAAGEVRDDG